MPFDGIRNSALVRTLADVLEDLPDPFEKNAPAGGLRENQREVNKCG
jgi:hypothetical protein